MLAVEYWIEKLNLKPHVEGGFYHETFAANEIIEADALPYRYGADRKHYTSIYFLLKSNQTSRFHRIKSDEIWTFHYGAPLSIHLIDKKGIYSILTLGTDLEKGERPQQMVPAGSWFGARIHGVDTYSLVGCFVAPGFDFSDLELAHRKDLLSSFPEYKNIIEELTNDD